MSRASQKPTADEDADIVPDVHGARTAVAPLSMTVLEELRRAKMARRPASFTSEAPTVPGKDGMRLLRPLAPDVGDVPPASSSESLAGAMLEALENVEPLPTLPAPRPSCATPDPLPVIAPVALPVITPIPTSVPTPSPFVAMMAVQLPQETRVPRVPIQLTVALVIVASTAVVLAIVAVAESLIHP